MSHVFISYSTRDSSYATRLAEKLRAEGFDVWIDNNQLRSSEDWWRSIVLAIDACAAFVVILTPGSDQSKWVQREVTLADQREKPMFPLLLAGEASTPNWSLFVRTQYDDVRDGRLPDAAFYTKLAEYAPRKPAQMGVNVVAAAPVTAQTDDPVLQAEIADPPEHPARWRGGLAAVVTIVVSIIAGIVLLASTGLPDQIRSGVPSTPQLSPQQHLILGVEAAEDSDYDIAIEEFTLALDGGYRPIAEALTLRGDMHRYLGDMATALGDYDLALVESPEFYGALRGRSTVYYDMEQFDRVIQDLSLAQDVAPTVEDRVETLTELGGVYRQVGDYNMAVDQYSRAIAITRDLSERADLQYELGVTFLDMQNFELALANLQRSADMNPEFRDSYLHIAQAHEGLDDTAAALQAYNRYIELSEQQDETPDEAVLRRIQQLERDLS